MPIYEYQCQSCDHKLEALQKMADAPLTRCRHCGHDSLKKLISAAAFKLKGSGWYETDFKNSNKPQSANADRGDKAGSGNTSSGDKASNAKAKSGVGVGGVTDKAAS